jgi:hypothetical protein
MNRFHTPRLFLVAALGALAMLALPSFAAARAGGHHHAAGGHHHANRHAKHRRAHRRILIHGTASNTAASPTEQENAGEVESFDGTTLTIKLFAGGTVSGKVTESTEIECELQSTEAQASEDNQGENQQSGDQQSGDQSSGDQSQQSGDQSQQSEDQSGDEEDSSDTEDQSQSSSCDTAALVPGAVVHEAELDVSSAGAVFHSVDLAS